MDRASRRFCHPLHGWSGVWRYGDMAKRWQRAAAAGQCVRGDLGRQWQRVWCLVDRAGRGPSRPKPHTCGDPRRRPAWAKARQGSADFLGLYPYPSFSARRCVLPGRLSFNVLKHLHRASVLRFPRQRTLNPETLKPKTLKHPKTVHPKTKTLKPLNPKPENPAFPAVLPAISPIIFQARSSQWWEPKLLPPW